MMERGEVEPPRQYRHAPECVLDRKRVFLVGMVNRLQHGTARRVPHYPETRA